MMESMVGLPETHPQSQTEIRSPLAREPIYTNGYQTPTEKSAFAFVKPRTEPSPDMSSKVIYLTMSTFNSKENVK